VNNLHLFELINAAPGLGPLHLAVAIAVARWLIYLVPLALAVAWVRGDTAARRELLQVLVAVGLAVAIAQVVAHVWPQPRPFALHLGTQYLDHATDPGLPSEHVTVFWALALATLRTRRFALWGLPLLAVGLLVGWSRIYLGVHFPLDVAAALPVAWASSAMARAVRTPLMPAFARVLYLYDRLVKRWRGGSEAQRKT